MKMPKIKQSRNKFNARKTIVDGIVFHSAAEANRYKILKLLEKSGRIVNLKLQEPFVFKLHGKKIFTYFADFVYVDMDKGVNVIEDVKGMRTPLYKLKKKLIEAYYGIKITEVK